MHLSEFKAWFDGFTEDMEGPPNPKQWKKIRARVAEITNDYTPTPIFIDRYVTPYRRYWHETWYCSLSSNNTDNGSGGASLSIGDWSNAGRVEYRAT